MSLLFACASKPPPQIKVTKAAIPKASPTIVPATTEAAMIALAMMDKPYHYGSQSIGQGFDCSGLVCFVYKQIGLKLPRTTAGLSQTGQKIPLSKLQPGDLVFFSMSRRGNDHVGIYIGDGRFIHAPSTGKVIHVESLNKPYWQRRLTQARRVNAYVEYESARR